MKIGVPRILEESKDLINQSEYVQAALKLESDVSEEEISKISSVLDQDVKGLTKKVNTYLHAWNYMKENRINMNFRQVHL